MAFLEKLAAGLSGFGAGVQDPSYAMKLMQQQQENQKAELRRSKLAELAQLQDPQAMLRGLAEVDPTYLPKLAEYYQQRNAPKLPQTAGLPEGYMWNNGQAVKIPGVENTGKPQSPEAKLAADFKAGLIDENTYNRAIAKQVAPTEKSYKQFQLQAASFADRMSKADEMMKPIESSGVDVVNEFSRGLSSIPSLGLGKMLGNAALDPQQQLYMNAASEWIRAKLRKESGAAIPDSEMEQEYRTYFPITGDSPEVVKQKAELRKNNTASMVKQASGAYEDQYLGETPINNGWSIREKK